MSDYKSLTYEDNFNGTQQELDINVKVLVETVLNHIKEKYGYYRKDIVCDEVLTRKLICQALTSPKTDKFFTEMIDDMLED